MTGLHWEGGLARPGFTLTSHILVANQKRENCEERDEEVINKGVKELTKEGGENLREKGVKELREEGVEEVREEGVEEKMGQEDNFWYEEAAAAVAAAKLERVERGKRYSAVLHDYGQSGTTLHSHFCLIKGKRAREERLKVTNLTKSFKEV